MPYRSPLLDVPGSMVLINNVVSQSVPHLHLHVIPRRPKDGLRFWLGPRQTGEGFRESHIAFQAPDRAAVVAFRDAAVALGAEVLHEPRVWPEYHPTYYGAFVRDPDGNNVEAVTHRPE